LNVAVASVSETGDDRSEPWALTAKPKLQVGDDKKASVQKTLELLIDGEVKLLAACDARQASADTRTTALATGAIALPTLTLSLSNVFAKDPFPLQALYVVVVATAGLLVLLRAWNGWRGRRINTTDAAALGTDASATAVAVEDQRPQLRALWTISAETIDVTKARKAWRAYQRTTSLEDADPIRVQQLALDMWRARAKDSHKVAQIKDKLSVVAAVVFVAALTTSAVLVAYAQVSS